MATHGGGDMAPRMLLPTERSDLRATWHADRGVLSVTLWRGDVCVGSAHLSAEQSGELAAFIARHLGLAAVPGALEHTA